MKGDHGWTNEWAGTVRELQIHYSDQPEFLYFGPWRLLLCRQMLLLVWFREREREEESLRAPAGCWDAPVGPVVMCAQSLECMSNVLNYLSSSLEYAISSRATCNQSFLQLRQLLLCVRAETTQLFQAVLWFSNSFFGVHYGHSFAPLQFNWFNGRVVLLHSPEVWGNLLQLLIFLGFLGLGSLCS